MRGALFFFLLMMFGAAAFGQSANFSASPLAGCPPMVVTFTDLSTGSPTAWSWDFGNSTYSTIKNPTAYYTMSGTYTVKLTVTNASGSNTLTKTNYITVKAPPVPTLAGTPLQVCPGMPVSFTSSVVWNAAGSGFYNWDFGDGGTSTSASQLHGYSTPGIYTVRLTAINSAGCPGTDTQVNYVQVYQPPAITFYASDTAVCIVPGTTTFNATISGASPYTYYWDFGDGGNSTSAPPIAHTYTTAGSYSVKLKVTDSHGCTDSVRYLNYIKVRQMTAVAVVPPSVCQQSTLAVSSGPTTTPGATITWDFGDGIGKGSGSPSTYFYPNAATYVVRMFATVGGCTDTASNSVVVNPRPNTNFTFTPANPCPAPVVVTFNNTTTTSGTSNWVFDDGFTSSTASPLHTFNSFIDSTHTYNVKLTVTTAAGCTANITKPITIYSGRLTILDIPTEGCFPYTAKLHDTLYQIWPACPTQYCPIYPFPITSRSWNLGVPSITSSAPRPIYTYSNYGTYTVTEAMNTANGCTFYDTLVVHVGGHTNVNFYASDNPVCAGAQMQFFDSSIGIWGPVTGWQWDFGDTLNYGATQNPYTIYKKPGIYSVKLVTWQNGCSDTLIKYNYMTVKDPASIPKFRVSCDTLALVHFKDSSIGATSIKWYFGDGTTSTTSNIDHQYAGKGVYYGALVAWNSTTGCKDSTYFAVIINNFVLGISANDSTVCPGDTILLTPLISGLVTSPAASVGPTSWGYNSGGSSFSSLFSAPNFYPTSAGQYSFRVTVEDNNKCLFKFTANNFITVGGPKAHMKATPPFGCAPANILFTDTSVYAPGTTPGNRFWDYGDGTTGTTPFPAIGHTYFNIGSYGVTLKVQDNIGCKDSIGIPNYVSISHPTASFVTLGSGACVGTPYTFYSSSTGNAITHFWTFGDGTTSTASSPSHLYTIPGSYLVRLVVTDNQGCKDTMNSATPVSVSPRPFASFVMDDSVQVCPPLLVNFTNNSSNAVVYAWSFGNGSSSTLTSPSTTYASSGLYTPRLIATSAAGCHDTAYGTARVLGYKGVMSYTPLKGCAPLTVYFQANNVPGVAGFIYDFGDGITSATTSPNITHLYTKPGPHLPKVIMTDNIGCSATSLGVDTIKVDGVYAGFTFDPFPACDKGTIQFLDTSKGAYSTLRPPSWKFHDGTGSNLASPSKTYPGPGKYAVTLFSSTVSGCVDTFKSQVVFYPLPAIHAGADTTICISDSALLRPRGGASYVWSPAGSLSCANCTNPYAFPTTPTSYAVIGTDTNGCTNRDTIRVDIKYKTVTEVDASDKEICSGDTATFIAGGATLYQWIPPTGLSDPNAATTKAYPMETQHYVLISRLAGCIRDTDYVDLIVHPTPTVDAGKGATMIAGDMVHLDAIATGIITKYLWTPTEGILSPTQPSTDAMPKRTTTYAITVTTEYGCTATDTVVVVVLCDNSQVYLPNTFTPDGNGVNDVFYPRGKGIANIDHFRIYNRWGELVFERSNIAVEDKKNGWDGTKGGTLLTPDIYVYMVEATCDTGEPIKWQGDVMLLR